MRLGSERSSNVEDRRGYGLPIAGGGVGAIVIALLVLFFRGTPGEITTNEPQGQPGASAPAAGQDPTGDFVSAVLADTETTWHDIFRNEIGRDYEEPKLVLFSDVVQSSCGIAEGATGPFYCPLDGKVYLDTSFFRELDQRFGAPGDFAQAYVIAHEVGHHVQNLLGISDQVQGARGQSGRRQSNALSVRTELQADCFAGVWANHADKMRHILEQGDVEEGLNAASAIGDDRLQRETRGYAVPDSFTHGTSTQRVHWFRQGLQGGRVADCDTFNAADL
ncbi:MAG TPA: neutral zinc metallopeptidase [Thermoanaerobaculia bacterium]|nr:neutral zinc metallopeptidase [Thermoanaerobaculia bacterium]